MLRIVKVMARHLAPEALLRLNRENDMHSIIAIAKDFARDEDGITAIEYGLIAATMVAAVVAAFTLLVPALNTAFADIAAAITAAT